MAWKLRKEKLQSDAAASEAEAAETAALPAEAPEALGVAPHFDVHTADPDGEDAIPLVDLSPAGGVKTASEEPQFAPFDFSAPAFQADDGGSLAFHHDAPLGEGSATETEPAESPWHPANDAHFATALPSHDDPAILNPFAPYQPEEAPHTETPLALANPFVRPFPSDSVPPSQAMAPVMEPMVMAPPVNDPVPIAPDPQPVPDVDREAIAPRLVTQATEAGIPRVAPFIMDVPPVEEAPAVTGTLVLYMGKLSASFPITKDQTVIGRPDSAVQSYPDVEIELDDAVSRRHAEIRRHDGGYYLVDTMSTNGTRLNGEKLEVYQEYPLSHGDRIRLGDRTEIIFE